MFTQGQKVACVDGTFNLPPEILKRYAAFPVTNGTYTVRDIVPGISPGGGEGEVTVYLVEIVNPPNKHGIEPGYNAERFAPLDTVNESKEETTLATLSL